MTTQLSGTRGRELRTEAFWYAGGHLDRAVSDGKLGADCYDSDTLQSFADHYIDSYEKFLKGDGELPGLYRTFTTWWAENAPPEKWTGNHDEIVTFGQVLYDADVLVNPGAVYGNDIFYYLQRPEKWDRDHEVWVGHQRPTKGDPGWDLFCKAINRLYEEDGQ